MTDRELLPQLADGLRWALARIDRDTYAGFNLDDYQRWDECGLLLNEADRSLEKR